MRLLFILGFHVHYRSISIFLPFVLAWKLKALSFLWSAEVYLFIFIQLFVKGFGFKSHLIIFKLILIH